jgi:Phage lysozyme
MTGPMCRALPTESSSLFNRVFGEPTGPMSRGVLFKNAEPKRTPCMSLAMSTTAAGRRMIFEIEVGPFKKRTAHLHWPGGASGVTLGPGYDMKDRKASAIESDLTGIGVDAATAKSVAKAAGLEGEKAETFAEDNEDLLTLTDDQQVSLLSLIVPKYEAIVNRLVHIPLKPHEFDALVSFVYNPGGKFLPVAEQVDKDDMEEAAKIMRQRVYSGGKTMKGLVARRARETTLLLQGIYG